MRKVAVIATITVLALVAWSGTDGVKPANSAIAGQNGVRPAPVQISGHEGVKPAPIQSAAKGRDGLALQVAGTDGSHPAPMQLAGEGTHGTPAMAGEGVHPVQLADRGVKTAPVQTAAKDRGGKTLQACA